MDLAYFMRLKGMSLTKHVLTVSTSRFDNGIGGLKLDVHWGARVLTHTHNIWKNDGSLM